jgi:hypothetical protein
LKRCAPSHVFSRLPDRGALLPRYPVTASRDRRMAETILHNGSTWTLKRLPSALDASRASNRIRPWLSRAEEEVRQQQRLEQVRRENGIPSPEEWMW